MSLHRDPARMPALRESMHLIQLHNRKRHGGGDSVAYARTCAILRCHGQALTEWTAETPIVSLNFREKLLLLQRSLFSRTFAGDLDALLAGAGPHLLHVHNLFPNFSPAVLLEARRRRIPLVFHCHNFRLTCPVETHFYKRGTCRKCLDRGAVMCVLQNCRGDLAESAAYALQSALARRLGIVRNLIDAYIAPTRFTRDWLVAAGIPAEKLFVLPYPVPAPESAADPALNEYVAFAGRIPPEKGLDTLLAALEMTGLPLQIAGSAPENPITANVTWRGFLQGAELDAFYRHARFLVVPSLWFETFGLVAGEAMAHGIPVIASRIGALAELVEDGRTGLLFSPGNADELAAQMLRLWNDPDLCRRLGKAGREKILKLCHPDIYYAGLMGVYEKVMGG